jgi:superfamily II DNA/RNA helicase
MTDFKQLGLSQELVTALERMKITAPTPIQEAAIPPALQGLDLLASAQTGTGKTIAYLLPLLIKLSKKAGSTALILAPTRELAFQVQTTLIEILGKNSHFKAALLIGGAPMAKQIKDLRRHPQLVIGTPGRIYDHLERRTLNLDSTAFLVIDEADRMMDMGFQVQLESIVEFLPQARQTLMFSATISSNIARLSSKYLKEPQRISIGSNILPAPKIKQETLHTTNGEKISHLLKELDQREGTILIFVKTRRNADRLARDLKQKGHTAEAIHGDLPQRRRDRVIESFRQGRNRILVATDIAARGLDIPHLMHVINYDLPQCPEDYIHRIGRTGRAGAEGRSLCLISPEDGRKWRAICQLMNPKGTPPNVPSGPGKPRHHSGDGRFNPRSKGGFGEFKKNHKKKTFFKKSNSTRFQDPSWKPRGTKGPGFTPSKGKPRENFK